MVWLFSSSSSSSSSSNKDASTDPYSKLDPSLRKFLERESPLKYTPATPPPPAPSEPPSSAPQTTPTPSSSPPSPSPPNPPQHPPGASLYPDGRYTHLWSTYTPLSTIENQSKTDQEQLLDVLSSYRERKASIGRAALENCADIHWTLNDCFSNGSWADRMTMCRRHTQELDRCYGMNSRFLKALGYLREERGSEEEERVQMEADRLYRAVRERHREEKEREIGRNRGNVRGEGEGEERADREGGGVAGGAAQGYTADGERKRLSDGMRGPLGLGRERPKELDMLTEDAKRTLAEKTKGMSPLEREAEERAFAAEIRAGIETNEKLEKYREEVRVRRKERLESGKGSFGDAIASWFGW